MQGTNPTQLQLILQNAIALSIPLKHAFRGIALRHTLIFKINNIWTEFCPFAEYNPHIAARWLRCAIAYTQDPHPPAPLPAICANATVPAVTPEKVPDVMNLYPGVWCAKIKVSTQNTTQTSEREFHKTLETDIERIKAVYTHITNTQKQQPTNTMQQAVGAEQPANAHKPKIRIDSNGTWSLAQAQYALTKIANTGIPIQYAEQPVSSLSDMQALKPFAHSLGIHLAADDILRKSATGSSSIYPSELRKAADIIILKPQPMGGIKHCLALAKHYDMPVTVSSALETPIGLFTGVKLFHLLNQNGIQTENESGLATFCLMPNILQNEWKIQNGKIHTNTSPSKHIHPPEPNQKALSIYKASPNMQMNWRTRLLKAHKILGTQTFDSPIIM